MEVNLEGILSGEVEGILVLPLLAGSGKIPATSEASRSLYNSLCNTM